MQSKGLLNFLPIPTHTCGETEKCTLYICTYCAVVIRYRMYVQQSVRYAMSLPLHTSIPMGMCGPVRTVQHAAPHTAPLPNAVPLPGCLLE